jgi:signal transduction histidine kinase
LSAAIIDEVEAHHPQRVRLAAAEEITGTWDPDRLAQALANLLANALNHGSPGSPVDVTLAQEDGAARIEVSNRGEPIPESMREAIFEPFRRAGTGPGAPPPGLGLGLYITREIVRAHRGSIELESGADRTTFSVRLPRDPSAAELPLARTKT